MKPIPPASTDNVKCSDHCYTLVHFIHWCSVLCCITFHVLRTAFMCDIMPSIAGPQWPRGLRRGSAAARLLRLWVRIPPGAWMFVCCKCCVLSGRGLCDGLITRPEESYRLWCVVVCDLEKSQIWGGHTLRLGCKRHRKKIMPFIIYHLLIT